MINNIKLLRATDELKKLEKQQERIKFNVSKYERDLQAEIQKLNIYYEKEIVAANTQLTNTEKDITRIQQELRKLEDEIEQVKRDEEVAKREKEVEEKQRRLHR